MPFFAKTRAGSILQRFGRDLADVASCNYSVLALAHRIVYSELARIYCIEDFPPLLARQETLMSSDDQFNDGDDLWRMAVLRIHGAGAGFNISSGKLPRLVVARHKAPV
jgi:hypothetical protein